MSIKALRERLNVPPPSEPAAPSLPPVPGETALSPAPAQPHAKVVPAKHSVIRKKAVAIIAMRAQGYTTDEIAAELQIKPASVWSYVYRAGKEGWLTTKKNISMLDDPKDQVEYELAHKVVRNLSAALDDTPVVTRDGEIKPVSQRMHETTMELARGTLFKKFDQQKESAVPAMQMLSVRIDMPRAAKDVPQVDVASMGGTPAYAEGEIVSDDDGE